MEKNNTHSGPQLTIWDNVKKTVQNHFAKGFPFQPSGHFVSAGYSIETSPPFTSLEMVSISRAGRPAARSAATFRFAEY